MTKIESDTIAVKNLANILADMIDGKCHSETSLEKFIYRKVSRYSRTPQTDISWQRFKSPCFTTL